MRFMRERLRRLPTWFLIAYVAIADVGLFAVIPLEIYIRSALRGHGSDVAFLGLLLAANVCLLLFFLTAMVLSTVLLRRGVSAFGALSLRPRRLVPVPARVTRPTRS